jgi:ATP synthase protein I
VTRPSRPENDAAFRERQRLDRSLERQAARMRRAEEERKSLIGETVYLGTIGVLFVVPVIAGAYLGRWLDERLVGYSVHWTLAMILLGVFTGAINVYLFIRERTHE